MFKNVKESIKNLFVFKRKNFHKGFTLIEGLIAIALFLVIFLALHSLFGIVFNTIKNNKARTSANSIALEQLEIVRGMSFNDVKTDLGWVPAGNIESERSIVRSGINFTVKTDIAFEDDDFDGLDPQDLFPYDYKKVRIKVTWESLANNREETVTISTNVVPVGLEGLTDDKGGILVTVFDASGKVLSGVNVHIENVQESYSVDALTDLNGHLWVPDLNPNNGYHVVVTKDGYSSDQTYPINNDINSPDYNPNPIKPDFYVAANEVTAIGFSIDILGNLNIQTVNYNNPENWEIITSPGSDDDNFSMEIDSDDNIFLTWFDGDGHYISKYKYNSTSDIFDKQWAQDISEIHSLVYPRIAFFETDYFYVFGVNWGDYLILDKYDSGSGNKIWSHRIASYNYIENDHSQVDLAIDSIGDIYVTWTGDSEEDGNYDIYVRKISSNKTSLWDFELKVNSDTGYVIQENPKIVVDDNDNFYITWEDEINGNKDIFLAKFDKDGQSLFAGKKINSDNSNLNQYNPVITFDGSDYLYLAWSDERNSQPDIYAQKIDKNGNIVWTTEDVKINDDTFSDAWRTNPAVAFSNDDTIYFSWEDDRNDNVDIYSTKFDSDGNKLWDYDLIMHDNSSLSHKAPDVVVDSFGYGITAWEDNTDGMSIFITRYNELELVIRENIGITVTGSKTRGTDSDGLPLYKFSETFFSDSDGFINLGDQSSILEWDDYTFTVDVADVLYEIISIDQPDPVSIYPAETENVVINIEP